MSVLAEGWQVAYLPQLRLEHLIPASRLSCDYLARYAYGTNKTWVQVLDVHGIRPWPRASAWTLLLESSRPICFSKLGEEMQTSSAGAVPAETSTAAGCCEAKVLYGDEAMLVSSLRYKFTSGVWLAARALDDWHLSLTIGQLV